MPEATGGRPIYSLGKKKRKLVMKKVRTTLRGKEIRRVPKPMKGLRPDGKKARCIRGGQEVKKLLGREIAEP